jgi:protein phosphatase 1G
MGAFLNKPATEKEFEAGENSQVSYGAVSMQGWRKTQEDAHIVDLALPGGCMVFGVFDGHGGTSVSLFVKEHFTRELVKSDAYGKGDYAEALRQNFARMDQLMLSREG